MIILDTHTLLWSRSDPMKLSKKARMAIDHADRLGVSSITCWEVTMLVTRGRIELDRPIDAWIQEAVREMEVVDMSCAIASAAGRLDSATFHGDPADRIIWATTQACNAQLVTADRALRSFSPHGTIW